MGNVNYTSNAAPRSLDKLNGGLNSTSAALGVADNEATDLQNIDFDIFGSFKKRNGYEQLNTVAANSGAACTGLYFAEFKAADILTATFEDGFFKMDDLDGTWDSVTLSGASISTGQDLLMDFTMLNDILLFTNGNDAPVQWTGSGNAAAAGVPTGLTKAKFVATWNNYAFYANVTVSGVLNPTRVYWSNLKDPTTWSATDFIDVDKDDGQVITGIQPLGDRLVVFKERSIHFFSFTGDSDIPFIVVKTPSDVGCISGYSIQEVENGLMFRASDGYYFFDGNDSIKVSDRINTTVDGLADNRSQYVVSAYQRAKGRYWSSVTTSGGTSHDKNIIWDSRNNAFSVYSGINANAITIVNTAGEERIYFGDYAGFVYRADTGDNDNPEGNETAIDAFWKSKWFNFGDLFTEKSSTNITFYHEIDPATITMGYSYDLDESDQYQQSIYIGTIGAVYGSAMYDVDKYAVAGGLVKRRNLVSRGRVLRLSFYNNTVDETFQINGFGFSVALETDQ